MRRPGITQALRLMHTYLVSCKVHDLWYLPWLFYVLNQDFLVFCCIIVALILPDNSGFQPNYLLSENRMSWKKIRTKPGNYCVIQAGKFLTMATELDKNSSKWSYYFTDHKNYIKIFFEHFLSKLLDPQKSTFGDVILGIKLF